jgi:hypothetical protein
VCRGGSMRRHEYEWVCRGGSMRRHEYNVVGVRDGSMRSTSMSGCVEVEV